MRRREREDGRSRKERTVTYATSEDAAGEKSERGASGDGEGIGDEIRRGKLLEGVSFYPARLANMTGRLFSQKGPGQQSSGIGLASGEIECSADRLIPANETARVFFNRRRLGSPGREQ